jgi:hypothetical protein
MTAKPTRLYSWPIRILAILCGLVLLGGMVILIKDSGRPEDLIKALVGGVVFGGLLLTAGVLGFVPMWRFKDPDDIRPDDLDRPC